MTCDDARILMMQQVDGVIGEEDARLLAGHLGGCASCRAEMADFTEQKQVTDLIRERLQYDKALDRYWGGVYNRLEQRVGWSLVLIGISILVGFGLVHLCIDPEVPLWLRIGVGTASAGGLTLLVATIRWRIVTGRKDKYTEVVR